ncbi:hypothetical protein [cf. Phormidesmis sp. LEGE 11477]|uniref:hypothetical protein n=1 Tax=cf. Phormidesmis sp. LEGE 11477 TaxID=1828680 RepID=UPI00187E20F5|nr:hypothetical protein [cf. Phormidesmis sp. LEGE 11477]MBE9062252.1 hypothetical protein [cf. Phormidesmis sp. LEGE 11477]
MDRTLTIDSDTCDQPTIGGNSSICHREGILRFLCFNPKTPEQSQFQVLEPDVVSGPRPDIEWEAVPEAQSYTIYVVGSDIEWQRATETATTSLAYPADESPLTIGTAYEIIITAVVDEQITASASTVVNVRDTAARRVTLQLAARMNGAQ